MLSVRPVQAAGAAGATGMIKDICCAVRSHSGIILGSKSGHVYVVGADGVLERSFPVGRGGPVTALCFSAPMGALAVAADGEATIWDLETRKCIHRFPTTSATGLGVTRRGAVVVASKYKLRWWHAADARHDHLWEAPERVRSMCVGDDDDVVLLLSSGQVLVVDLWRERIRMRMSLDYPKTRWASPQYWAVVAASDGIVSAIDDHVFLGPRRLIDQITGSLSRVGAFVTLSYEDTIIVINPRTGAEVASTRTVRPLRLLPENALGLFEQTNQLVEVALEFNVSDVLMLAQSGDLTEALSQAEVAGLQDSDIARLQQRLAGELLSRDGDVVGAAKLLESVEATGQLENSAAVGVHILEPVIAGAEAEMPAPVDDDTASVFSTQSRTSSRASSSRTSLHPHHAHHLHRQHPLDPVVHYLLFSKRRLRLSNHNTSPEVDTALFRCYMAMRSPLVAPLLRSQNACDPEVVKEKLEKVGKWRELAAFLRSKGHHREALQLLVTKSETPEGIVAYLEGLDFGLVEEFAPRVLEHDSKYSVALFWDEESYDSAQVLKLLQGCVNSSQVVAYLEYRVFKRNDPTPELHEALAICYGDDSAPKMLQFLDNTNRYRPDILLGIIKDVPSRALLYGRLGKHAAAIDEYLAHNDLNGAEKYAQSAPQLALHHLVNRLLADYGPEEHLAPVLNRNASKVQPGIFLELPGSLLATRLSTYLVGMTAELAALSRHAELVSSLRRVDLTETSARLAAARKKNWTVTEWSTCARCHKRLGKSVLGVIHDQIVHYGCLTTFEASSEKL